MKLFIAVAIVFCFVIPPQETVASLNPVKMDAIDSSALLDMVNSASDPLGFLYYWDPSLQCNAINAWSGVSCDASSGKVITLTLGGVGISGPFINATAFAGTGALNKVSTLDLSGNSFSVEFPAYIQYMTALTSVDLSTNSFIGTIPAFISQLLALTYLSLSTNNFIGPIPATLSQLGNLSSLNLDQNYLDGTIPPSLDVVCSKSTNFTLNCLKAAAGTSACNLGTQRSNADCAAAYLQVPPPSKTAFLPPQAKSPPPHKKIPPPFKGSPPLPRKTPPPPSKKASPPPTKKSLPPAKKFPPPAKKSPPPAKKSPLPTKKFPPPFKKSPPPAKKSPRGE